MAVNVFRVTTCVILAVVAESARAASPEQVDSVEAIFKRIREYPFNPIVAGFTKEPALKNRDGVENLEDEAWRVRLLAIPDLVRLGESAASLLQTGLSDENLHVRHVSAFVLGLVGGEHTSQALQRVLSEDKDPVLRSQAALSLGQLGAKDALSLLQKLAKEERNRDVRHQCVLAAYRIENGRRTSEALAEAYAALDPAKFEQVRVGAAAPEFSLKDTTGKTWRLSDFKGDKTVVLVWIFADWCPVCHNEFDELIDLRDAFKDTDVQVFTIECHDVFRARVMTGEELRPRYWFTHESPQERYSSRLWWPHLVDTAGAVGAMYGVQPMEFVVHAEWINRPATIIVDKDGIVRFAYYGTFWGDRPSIEQTLEMVVSGEYEFEHPKRLKAD